LGYRDADAEDVVQEVFLAVHCQLDTFEFRSSFYHWLYRICMYQCYEVIRKRRRQVAMEDEGLEALSRTQSTERAAQEESERRKTAVLEVVREERDAMGEPCKSLLELRDVKGTSYAEIADTLRIPVGTVMSRLARCKETLKMRIGKKIGLKP